MLGSSLLVLESSRVFWGPHSWSWRAVGCAGVLIPGPGELQGAGCAAFLTPGPGELQGVLGSLLLVLESQQGVLGSSLLVLDEP